MTEIANLPQMLQFGQPGAAQQPAAAAAAAAPQAPAGGALMPPPSPSTAGAAACSFTLRMKDTVWRDEAHWAFCEREHRFARPATLPEFHRLVERHYGLRSGSVRLASAHRAHHLPHVLRPSAATQLVCLSTSRASLHDTRLMRRPAGHMHDTGKRRRAPGVQLPAADGRGGCESGAQAARCACPSVPPQAAS